MMLLVPASSPFAASELTYDPGMRRDPFVPLTEEASVPTAAISSGLKLEGIVYDPEGRSMVMLSGKAYQAGEAAGNATVVKIFKDHVVILVGEEEKTLWIREEEKT